MIKVDAKEIAAIVAELGLVSKPAAIAKEIKQAAALVKLRQERKERKRVKTSWNAGNRHPARAVRVYHADGGVSVYPTIMEMCECFGVSHSAAWTWLTGRAKPNEDRGIVRVEYVNERYRGDAKP